MTSQTRPAGEPGTGSGRPAGLAALLLLAGFMLGEVIVAVLSGVPGCGLRRAMKYPTGVCVLG